MGSAASVISNAVEGMSFPSLGEGSVCRLFQLSRSALVGLGCSAHTSESGCPKSPAPMRGMTLDLGCPYRLSALQ